MSNDGPQANGAGAAAAPVASADSAAGNNVHKATGSNAANTLVLLPARHFRVSVPEATVGEDFTVYTFSVRVAGRQGWSVLKRFSSCAALVQRIQARHPGRLRLLRERFPAKAMWGNRRTAFLEQRRAGLHRFFSALCASDYSGEYGALLADFFNASDSGIDVHSSAVDLSLGAMRKYSLSHQGSLDGDEGDSAPAVVTVGGE